VGGRDFPQLSRPGTGAHPASCTMNTASFQGLKSGWGMTLTPHPLLVPWSRKGRAIPLLPLWTVRLIQILSQFHDNENSYMFYWITTPNNLIHEYTRPEDHAVSILRAASSAVTVTISGRLHHQSTIQLFAPPLRMQYSPLKGSYPPNLMVTMHPFLTDFLHWRTRRTHPSTTICRACGHTAHALRPRSRQFLMRLRAECVKMEEQLLLLLLLLLENPSLKILLLED